MGCFVYMVFGTARDINYGPTAVMALLTAEFCHAVGDPRAAVLLTCLSGIIQVAIGFMHIGGGK
jgi:sodium-independent sulfate anion transporter 11